MRTSIQVAIWHVLLMQRLEVKDPSKQSFEMKDLDLNFVRSQFYAFDAAILFAKRRSLKMLGEFPVQVRC